MANQSNSQHTEQRASPRLVGINHVALEVGNIGEALDFYGQLFDFELRGRAEGRAFIDIGDQFLALMEGRAQPADEHRHFGLVVDDKAAVRARLEAIDADILPGDFLDFIDPWGNRIQIVEYSEIQFSKPGQVLAAMDLDDLEKTPQASAELAEKGMS